MEAKHTPVTEWVGDFKLMADFLATIEESAHHTNETKDWSDRLCDASFFAQRVAHVMLDLQPKFLGLLEALKDAQATIDATREELHQRRVADWYPEGAHNAAEQMSEDMRLIGNGLVTVDFSAAIAKAEGRNA